MGGVRYPAKPRVGGQVGTAKRAERSLELRRRGGVAVDHERGEPVEELVRHGRRLRRRRPRPRSRGHVQRPGRGGQAVGEQGGEQRLQVRLARRARVERLELLRRPQQQLGGVAAAVDRERDLGPQQIDPDALELLERPGLRRAPASASAGSNAPARRLASAAASRRSARRAGSGVSSAAWARKAASAATPPRACARLAERSSSSATSSSGPAAARARCQARRSGSSARSVTSASARCTACRSPAEAAPIDGRTHERVREAHAMVELEQVRRGRGVGRLDRDLEPLGAAPHQHRIADRLRRREQQEPLRVGGQGLHAPPEALLDPPLQRARVWQAEPPGELGRRHAARQLQQGEGIPARLGDDPVSHARVQRAAHGRRQQRTGVHRSQAADRELGQSSGRARPRSRRAKIRATGSASSRRATNISACSEA